MTDSFKLDEKTKKSLLNLKYLAYIFLAGVFVLGFVVSTYAYFKLIDMYPKYKVGILIWLFILYFTAFMIMYGIRDVLKLLNNLYTGNIFSFENANILKIIDKKIIFLIIFSIIVNIIMVILDYHQISFILIWLVFIMFLLVGHVIVNPLSLLVKKSADMKLEMELTI